MYDMPLFYDGSKIHFIRESPQLPGPRIAHEDTHAAIEDKVRDIRGKWPKEALSIVQLPQSHDLPKYFDWNTVHCFGMIPNTILTDGADTLKVTNS